MKNSIILRLLLISVFTQSCCRQNNTLKNSMKANISNRITSGTYGFYLKSVNGCVITSFNGAQPFYLASSIKVLQLVHAMRAVQAGQVSLTDKLTKFAIQAESCHDIHTNDTPTVLSLEKILLEMMVDSDNKSTNAVQEFFGNGDAIVGRQRINNTAHSILQLSAQTAINHKFLCGGGPANNPANSLTLLDIGKLYESIANGLLNSRNTEKLDEIMLGLRGPNINRVIDEVAASIGVNSQNLELFKSQIKSRRKNGNFDDTRYQSIGGWVSLPFRSGTPKQYVFGIYVNNAVTNQVEKFMDDTAADLLRLQIKEALTSFL